MSGGVGARAQTASGARVGWPDVAKGVCIVLVVLWHVVVKHSAGIDWQDAAGVPELWLTVSAQLLPLRMPLFFVVSGIFAARVIAMAESLPATRRMLRLALLYVLWVLIQTVALPLAGPQLDTAWARDPVELIWQLTLSPTNLWYLLALSLYLLIGRITRGLPSGVVLPSAFLVSALAATGIVPDAGNLWQVGQNLFFFLAGLRLRGWLMRFAEASSGVRGAGLAGLYLVAAVLVSWLGARQWFGVWMVLSAIAVLAGVSICVLVDRVEPVAAGLRWIGRRTLPIYVIHMIPLALVDRMLSGVDAWVFSGPVLAALEPLLVTAVVIAASLGAHALLMRIGAGRLFDPLMPRRVRGAVP